MPLGCHAHEECDMEGWLRYPHFDSRRGFWHILQFSTDSCTKNPAFWPWVIRLKLKKTKGFDFQEFLEIWSKSLFFSKMKLTPSVSFWIFWSKITFFLLFVFFLEKQWSNRLPALLRMKNHFFEFRYSAFILVDSTQQILKFCEKIHVRSIDKTVFSKKCLFCKF